MARFLFDTDYSSVIQDIDFLQITEGDSVNVLQSEAKAISKMRTKLVQRYAVDIELGENKDYDSTIHYKLSQRAISGGSVFHVLSTFKRYDNKTEYTSGTIVYDSEYYIYTCIADNTGKELTDTDFWEPMVDIDTSDTNYWIEEDNRYPLFIEIAMDLALYNIYSRINPRNIPDLRVERNREALDQLDRWASGTDTAEVLNILEPEFSGVSIISGASSTKQTNDFM